MASKIDIAHEAKINCWKCQKTVTLTFHRVYTTDKRHWEGMCPCGTKNYIYRPSWDQKGASGSVERRNLALSEMSKIGIEGFHGRESLQQKAALYDQLLAAGKLGHEIGHSPHPFATMSPEEIQDAFRPGSLEDTAAIHIDSLDRYKGMTYDEFLKAVKWGNELGNLGAEDLEEIMKHLRPSSLVIERGDGVKFPEAMLDSLTLRPNSPLTIKVDESGTVRVEEPGRKVPQRLPSTQEVIDAYLTRMEDAGAANGYLRVRARKLRFFARQHPTLPTDPGVIRVYLRQFKTADVPTRQDQWKALAALYKFATKTYGIPNPILLDVDKPHFKKKPGKRLSRDQAKRFLSVVKTDLEWSLVTCYFGLRLRRVEAERLLSEGIKSDYITVVGGKERGEELPLLPIFKDMLVKVENHGPNGRHFPIKADTMAYHIERIGRRAGFEVTPHMLRNTAAALWYYYGGDKSSNRMLLRHSTDDMTDHYSNEFLDELRIKDERHNAMLNLMRELGLVPAIEDEHLKTRGDKLVYQNTTGGQAKNIPNSIPN